MKISKLRDVKTPERGTEKSAGIDFFVPNDLTKEDYQKCNNHLFVYSRDNENDKFYVELMPHQRILIPSGVKVNVPEGYGLIAFNKGGIAVNRGLDIMACVIDEDFQGEVFLNLVNTSYSKVRIYNGDKIAQAILLPVFYDKVEVVDEDKLYESETERGEGMLGSTGVK